MGQRSARCCRRLPQRVQFGEPNDVGDQRIVFPGLRGDGVDLVEPELQPVGLLGKFAGAVAAVDEVAPRRQPRIPQLAVTLTRGAGCREAVQRTALLFGPHQPQLIVLSVQGEQLGGEPAQ